MTPEVSILIPVYNVEKYIKQCLESIASDSMIHLCEIIICNDCSPDNSIEIVKKFIDEHQALNVKLIEHSQNKKIAITRQDLLNVAIGKYILFVDSDDWVESNFISTLYNAAEKNNADITTCDYSNVYSNKRIIKTQLLDTDSKINIKRLITTKIPGYLPCKLLRRSIIRDNDITFDDDLIVSEDVLFVLKLLFHTNKYYNTNLALYNYRIISSHSDFSDMQAFEKIKCIQKIEDYLIKNNAYELYKSDVAFRKIHKLIEISGNAPYKKCHCLYPYFRNASKDIQIKSLKTFIYKIIAISIDKKKVLLTDLIISFLKVKYFLRSSSEKKL